MALLNFVRVNLHWLAVGMLMTAVSSFGQTFFISIFADQIKGDFGLSDGEWGAIYMIGTGASAVVMVWAGGLADRYSVRVLGSVVLVLLAAACVFMAANPYVWLLPVAVFLLRFAGQGMTTHIGVVAMARWFVAARGKALFVAGLGFSASEAILPIIFVSAMAFVGWRSLWVVGAVVVLASIPLLQVLTRTERSPKALAEDQDSTGIGGAHWTRGQVLHHWLFWAMVPGVMLPSMFGTALFFQQAHYVAVKGWAHLAFVAWVPVYSVSVISFMLLSGLAIDRWGSVRLMGWFMWPMAGAFVAFGLADDPAWMGLGFALFGIMQGTNSTLPGAFWAELYGTRHIGSIKALVAAIMVLGSALGPGLTGWLIDRGIDFPDQMPWIAGLFGASSLMMFVALRRSAAWPGQDLRR